MTSAMKHDSLPGGRGRALVAAAAATLAAATGLLALPARPSEAVIPQPTTTTTIPTRPTVPRTTVPRPTTPTTVATTVAEPPTTPPAPPSTGAPPPSTAPTPGPPQPGEDQPDDEPPADDEPDVQPFELCVPHVVDRYYTISQGGPDWGTLNPYNAGLGVGAEICNYNDYDIKLGTGAGHGAVVVDGYYWGEFEYDADDGFTGTDSFTFRLVVEGTSDVVDEATAYITVTDDCSAVAAYDYYVTNFETSVSQAAPGFLDNDDLECDPYTVHVTSQPADGELTGEGNGDGGFKYTPDDGFYGPDQFTYEVRDDNQQVLTNSVVKFYVSPPQCKPSGDAYSTSSGTPLLVDAPGVLDNDFVCPYFEEVIATQPADGDVTMDPDGGFQYTPHPGFVGQDSFTYYLNESFGHDESAIFATVIIDVTCAVALVDDVYDAAADNVLHLHPPGPGANDTLCDPAAGLQVVDPTANGSLTMLGSGDVTYTPNPGFIGTDTFTYTVAAPAQPLMAGGFSRPAGSPEPMATVTINVMENPPATTTTTTTTTVTTTTVTTEPATTEPPVGTAPPGTASEAAQPGSTVASADAVRVATFNASMYGAAAGALVEDLSTPDNAQAAAIAEVIQRTQPDIVLLNEFDYVEAETAVDLFRSNYLAVSQNGADPIDYPYAFTAPVNAGVDSGLDLNHDGTVGGPEDAFGFGWFPGQYGMVVLSKYPIVTDQVRTFQNLLWASMPGARLPDDPTTPDPGDWYSPEELAVLRLSSKSHWDVPIDVDGRIIHVLASNPTPPGADGSEDRNGLRNADEIAFWADYVAGTETSWIVDDAGTTGGLAADAEFVILGDLNGDPVDGDSVAGATQQLIGLERVQDPLPTSEGAVEAAQSQPQGLAIAEHQGDPATDTADFVEDPGPGNLRADYVLPSDGFTVVAAGVFWPPTTDPLSSLVTGPFASSDHRLVWVDVA